MSHFFKLSLLYTADRKTRKAIIIFWISFMYYVTSGKIYLLFRITFWEILHSHTGITFLSAHTVVAKMNWARADILFLFRSFDPINKRVLWSTKRVEFQMKSKWFWVYIKLCFTNITSSVLPLDTDIRHETFVVWSMPHMLKREIFVY